jgi:hypothetical protein
MTDFTIRRICEPDYFNDELEYFEEEEEEEEEEEDYDPRRNSFEAFGEWFNKEVRSLDDIEKNDEDFDDVVREWCNNNNHEIREDGIYNMNISILG